MTARQQLGVVATVVVLAAIVLVAARHFLGNEIAPLGAGTRAPDFRAVTLGTPPQTRTMADYRGKVVLLNIWATWCTPCRAEMPNMQQLYDGYAGKGLKVVAISIDNAGSDGGIRAFANDLGLTFDILHDAAGAIQGIYQTTGVPESVLIGKDGIIRKKIAGAIDWNSPTNRTLVEQLLAE